MGYKKKRWDGFGMGREKCSGLSWVEGIGSG